MAANVLKNEMLFDLNLDDLFFLTHLCVVEWLIPVIQSHELHNFMGDFYINKD
jgi:hypothetical protein